MVKKKHKWKYQINIRKKILVLIILGVSLFVGLGYAIIESNLNIFGTLEVSKYDKTLYGVFVKNYNTGSAIKYNGSHNDSIDSSLSTENIYYWDVSNDSKANDALTKNNVLFADHCWKMYRTTDTGGVKLLYNGEPDITDNGDGTYSYDCSTNRGTHAGYSGRDRTGLNSNYYYASKYNYDKDTKKYSLDYSDDDPIIYKKWSDSEANNLYGYYTCKSATQDATCDTLYYVESYYSNTQANCMLLKSSSNYSEFGTMPYNATINSPAYSGYMYGDLYVRKDLDVDDSLEFYFTLSHNITNATVTTDFYYADDVNYINNEYVLDNPTQVTDGMNYSDLIGKYVRKNTTVNYQVYYVVAVSGSKIYYRVLEYGDKRHSITLADEVVDNHDNTFSLDNDTTVEVELVNWYTNYSNYKFKYTCGDNRTTCSDMKYGYSTDSTSIKYVPLSTTLTIAKTKNNLVLNNPVTIRADEWYKGYNTTYSDYYYTCGNSDTTCTESNLRYIYEKNATKYKYYTNHYYGNSVIYENGVYKLQNIEDLDTPDKTAKSTTHHYVCENLGEKECSTVLYAYYFSGGVLYTVPLNDPDVTSAQDVLDAMFDKNTNDSLIKKAVDEWYEHYLTGYENYLDDVIYCNDRSYDTRNGYKFTDTGWYDNGGNLNKYLYFRNYDRDTIQGLDCPRTVDSFSYGNNKAHLKYKVGLATYPEMQLLDNSTYRKTGSEYKLLSPTYYQYDSVGSMTINSNGGRNYTRVTQSDGVRPVITLVNSTTYKSGTGRVDDPFIIE